MNLSVLSYNLWFSNHRLSEREESFFDTVHALEPDLIAVQELRADRLDGLRDRLDYPFTAISVDGYGVAIFSRFPIVSTRITPLSDSRMGRTLLETEIELSTVDGRSARIVFATAHCESEFGPSNPRKIAQYRQIAERLDRHPRAIFAGDTNILPSEEAEFFPADHWSDLWVEVGDEESRATYDSAKNRYHRGKGYSSRLDRIVSTGCEPIEFNLIDGIGGLSPSDHFGVFGRLRLNSSEE